MNVFHVRYGTVVRYGGTIVWYMLRRVRYGGTVRWYDSMVHASDGTVRWYGTVAQCIKQSYGRYGPVVRYCHAFDILVRPRPGIYDS